MCHRCHRTALEDTINQIIMRFLSDNKPKGTLTVSGKTSCLLMMFYYFQTLICHQCFLNGCSIEISKSDAVNYKQTITEDVKLRCHNSAQPSYNSAGLSVWDIEPRPCCTHPTIAELMETLESESSIMELWYGIGKWMYFSRWTSLLQFWLMTGDNLYQWH